MIDEDKQITLSPIDPHYRKMAELDNPFFLYQKAHIDWRLKGFDNSNSRY